MSITYSKFVSFSGPILDLVLLLFVSYVQKRYQPYADIAYDDNYFYYFFQLFTAIYLRFYLPVNRLHAVCFQEFICLTCSRRILDMRKADSDEAPSKSNDSDYSALPLCAAPEPPTG